MIKLGPGMGNERLFCENVFSVVRRKVPVDSDTTANPGDGDD